MSSTYYNIGIIEGCCDILEEVVEELDVWGMNEIGESEEPTKWYEHEGDMRKVSLEHPDLVFKLTGEGEENGDLWVKYFKNGKMQICEAKITYDEFDESKLV